MDGIYALFIAIIGCDIQEDDLNEGEEVGMRRYPKSAEDAFKCFLGQPYSYESYFPSYYDTKVQYNYRDGHEVA
jgi:hypothetical protein